MPSKKLTKQKREELKAKKNSSSSNLLIPLTVIVIVAIVAVAAFMFLMPGEEKGNDDKEDPVDNDIPENYSPVANFDYISVEINSVNNTINVLANDTDLDNDSLTIISVESPQNGNVTISENKIIYTPNYNFTGYDIFSYSISDGNNHSASSEITVFVYDVDNEDEANPLAFINTSQGMITVGLYEDKVPNTVQNFINYANDDFYDGLVFHRVIDDFMIQGGGFYPDGTKKDTDDPINLEIDKSIRHVDGAIAMARTNDPNSATSQFYICDGPQSFLDDDYAVFGVTIDGLDVVRTIASVNTTTKHNMQNWPADDVMINSITIVEQ